ncbi:PREDICTED: uncharacterized protein LOC109167122 isoform X2 [Ipomoea nil]|uniref:uncharacterized protein LOC109167122 isoform X2 n=1 Tax=Ipomoea nil TaxID=35883 RepID=UPI0009009CC1|nr:PREDICTED: uncharacterized protein LOC109167122 isoform X2 [Ipomoea nil]
MAKGSRGRGRIASRQCQGEPYPSPSGNHSVDMNEKKCSKKSEKKCWDDAICSVCMEYPHKAVLILCSSHDKGCRPYMCGTSFRYSNCLKQYKKAYTKVTFPRNSQSPRGSTSSPTTAPFSAWHAGNCETIELACPLCRGQVKGWTVVEPAREYLNAKKRSCMHDGCSFAGNYKEMRKHVKAEHPSARPREINPLVEQKWMQLERELERNDVISAVTSAVPGAVVFGDYVIGEHYGSESEDEDEDGFDAEVEQNEDFRMRADSSWMSFLLFLQAFGSAHGSRSDRDTRHQGIDSNHGLGEGTVRINNPPQIGTFGFPDEDSGGIAEDVQDNHTTIQH